MPNRYFIVVHFQNSRNFWFNMSQKFPTAINKSVIYITVWRKFIYLIFLFFIHTTLSDNEIYISSWIKKNAYVKLPFNIIRITFGLYFRSIFDGTTRVRFEKKMYRRLSWVVYFYYCVLQVYISYRKPYGSRDITTLPSPPQRSNTKYYYHYVLCYFGAHNVYLVSGGGGRRGKRK